MAMRIYFCGTFSAANKEIDMRFRYLLAAMSTYITCFLYGLYYVLCVRKI